MKQKGRPYSIEKYDPDWVNKFEKEKRVILSIFKNKALQVEHVGSTSVENMWAKPQIDILVIVNSLADADNLTGLMAVAGYTYEQTFGRTNEKYFVKDAEDGRRLVSVHIRPQGSSEANDAIYFRDYLRSHPDEGDRYSQAKLEAYDNGSTDRSIYPLKKREILMELLQKARQWHKSTFNNSGSPSSH